MIRTDGDICRIDAAREQAAPLPVSLILVEYTVPGIAKIPVKTPAQGPLVMMYLPLRQ